MVFRVLGLAAGLGLIIAAVRAALEGVRWEVFGSAPVGWLAAGGVLVVLNLLVASCLN